MCVIPKVDALNRNLDKRWILVGGGRRLKQIWQHWSRTQRRSWDSQQEWGAKISARPHKIKEILVEGGAGNFQFFYVDPPLVSIVKLFQCNANSVERLYVTMINHIVEIDFLPLLFSPTMDLAFSCGLNTLFHRMASRGSNLILAQVAISSLF